ncbi:hypothetical protein GH714_040179 [Hevea brasiliensis]|uniref:Retrotransposon gag domain-containing protein n=1 Tax=Hevea brasiliensis TaxID=3981 RepID=A0A6A6MRN5_HEVBR|nr:hypothetical protein GH714_040179 [Hevea brasiliensis]
MAEQGGQEQAAGASMAEEQTGRGRRKGQTRARDPSRARDELGEVESRLDKIESHLITGDDRFEDLDSRVPIAPWFGGVGKCWKWRREPAASRRGRNLKENSKTILPGKCLRRGKSQVEEAVQRGAIRDYVKEFSEVLLEIPEYPDQELLFLFKDGLQAWARLEVERRGAPNLAAAITLPNP